MKNHYITLGVLLCLILFTGKIKSQNDTVCLTMQPSAADGNDIDAFITTQNVSANFGSYQTYESEVWTCSGPICIGRSLIRFDMSSIPAGATVFAGTMSLYAAADFSSGITGEPTYGSANASWFRRVTSHWAVDTVTWNNQPTTTDTDEVALPQSANTKESYALDVTRLIRDQIAHGNYGFELIAQQETTYYNSLIFGSSNNADSAIHPKIEICYFTTAEGINNINISNSLNIFPNPNSGIFNVKLPALNHDSKIEVYEDRSI
jgi:hypothetical protein